MAGAAAPALVEGLRLLRRVGAGGEGEVWEARDAAGRPRALKLIRPDALADPDEVARRARQLRRIEHPCLVRVRRGGILAEGRLTGWGFLDMEFVEGVALHDAPADPDVLERLAPLAEALDLLHDGEWSHGVPLVHRDVKPGNLIQTPEGEVVLVDPSTLRGLDREAHTRIGTPLFCAPEVLRGKVTPAADVYSFAATLVALASGARGQELADLLDDPSALGLPAGVAAALSHRPSDRPRSCQAVLTAAHELTRAFPEASGWTDETNEVTRVLRSEPDEPQTPMAAAPAEVLPWSVALGALVVAPVAAWGSGRPDALPTVAGFTAALHLFLQLVARRPLWPALFAPPLAWADLLAERLCLAPRRTAWASSLLLGGIGLGLLPAGTRLLAAEASPEAVTASTAGAALLLPALVALPLLRGPEAAVLRLLALPLWLAGTALLAAGAIVALPFALALGRAGLPLRRLGRALGSVVETVLPPR